MINSLCVFKNCTLL